MVAGLDKRARSAKRPPEAATAVDAELGARYAGRVVEVVDAGTADQIQTGGRRVEIDHSVGDEPQDAGGESAGLDGVAAVRDFSAEAHRGAARRPFEEAVHEVAGLGVLAQVAEG